MTKLHWQVDWKIRIDGSESERPKLAICGAMYPDFADAREEITCKKCLKVLMKEVKK